MEIKYRRDLYKLLPKKPTVAEVGVAEGFFSADMCAWGLTKLYMVDLWESNSSFPGDAGNPQDWHNKNYEAAINRVKGYPVEILRGPSVGMSTLIKNGSLDLVYLDACHSYQCVTDDISCWLHKLKKGGIMAGHDFDNEDYGVRQAVQDYCRNRYNIQTIVEDKSEDAGFWFQV